MCVCVCAQIQHNLEHVKQSCKQLESKFTSMHLCDIRTCGEKHLCEREGEREREAKRERAGSEGLWGWQGRWSTICLPFEVGGF